MLIILNWSLYGCKSVSCRESQMDCCTLVCTLWHVFARVIIQLSLLSTWLSYSPTWWWLKRLHCNGRVENIRCKTWILTQSFSAKLNPNNVFNTAVVAAFYTSISTQNYSQLATVRNGTQISFRIGGIVLKDLMSLCRIREVTNSNINLWTYNPETFCGAF